MSMNDYLNNAYFEWMYNLVCAQKTDNDHSYRKLLMHLHSIEFTYSFVMDSNRANDGINFRYIFGYNCQYPKEDIAKYLDNRPSSVLEMMVALAYRIEEQIMNDDEYGDRTGQWFWSMIASLNLGQMTDSNFDRNYVDDVIFRFLNHDYKVNGEGGLFTLSDSQYDVASVDIWTQAMWYLDENFYSSL